MTPLGARELPRRCGSGLEAAPVLEQLRAALASVPDLFVSIEGHPDADGADAHKLDFSARRTDAVAVWLQDAGIRAARMRPVGKGEAAPVNSNATADGKALNRRIEARRQ